MRTCSTCGQQNGDELCGTCGHLTPDQKLVRLGRDYTPVHMDEAERKKAVDSAMWRTCSPHEWVWTAEEQARMALFVLWATQRLEMMSALASAARISHEPEVKGL